MPKRERPQASSSAFRRAIEAADHLQWTSGLQAIKQSEGGGQISAAESTRLLGSAAIDDDCRAAYPSSNRWDYVVGYRRAGQALAHFIEVHSAETSDVSKVEKKFEWLLELLRQDAQRKLAALPREFHWVASGRIHIPMHLPQFKRLHTTLRKQGLRGPVKQLILA